MTGFVQEFSSFEAHLVDQDKKRNSQDNALAVAKKVKRVIINSQPEELNYTPESSLDPLKPLMQTVSKPRPSCQMPMHHQAKSLAEMCYAEDGLLECV